MKASRECIPCMFRQARNTAKAVTEDPETLRVILQRLEDEASAMDLRRSPAALSQAVYRIVADVTGVPDPFQRSKQETNAAAMRLMPKLTALVAAASDPLEAAVRAAVAGNIIDLGIGHAFDVKRDVEAAMRTAFAINALDDFRRELRPGRRLLYLGDNAGEIVFDTLLVREILKAGVQVTFTVKSAPIINDATMADAEFCGMTRLTRVIETGSDDIGVNWSRVSEEFLRATAAADVVLGKGHGNFETCDDRPGNFYFLLKAKCPLVAAELDVSLGDLVFKHKGSVAPACQ